MTIITGFAACIIHVSIFVATNGSYGNAFSKQTYVNAIFDLTSSNRNIFSRYRSFARGINRSPVNSPHKGQWRRAFDVFFDLHLNKRLIKHWWGWWFETSSHPLWRHCNVFWYTDSTVLLWRDHLFFFLHNILTKTCHGLGEMWSITL